jgi:phosphatidylinositol alpha-1,6-mannosyltransferase
MTPPARHLLVTNDFPPKVGGIQTYLWELWSRLDPATTVVLTARSDPTHAAFDAEQAARGLRIERVAGKILYMPTPATLRRVRRLAEETDARLVLFDPVFPLGLLGPHLGLPYGVVLHGAEIAVPARVPLTRPALARVLRGASLVVSAGRYPAAEAQRATSTPARIVEIPPGVDCTRFSPANPATRAAARARFGVPDHATLVVSVSRLVPRKGMDVLIDAAGRLAGSHPALAVVIAGAGRDAARLERRAAAASAPVHLLGRISEEEKAALLGAADVFAMVCRSRWGGLEQEGFGIVFLEAAAAGVAQVAGDSGGAAEAVEDEETGIVVTRPRDVGDVAAALRRLIDDPALRDRMGGAARARAEACFDYDVLAPRLAQALAEVEG